MDFQKIFIEAEEYLFCQKKLDVYERCLYFHFLKRVLQGSDFNIVITLNKVCESLNISEDVARRGIRALNNKRAIVLEKTSRAGFHIRFLVPRDVPGVIFDMPAASQEIDIDKIDFYSGAKYKSALLERQGGKCFYSLRAVTADSCELDHIIPQSQSGDNSYRNVVVADFEINKKKGSTSADDFIRSLYRAGLLRLDELEDRLRCLADIMSGQLKPKI